MIGLSVLLLIAGLGPPMRTIGLGDVGSRPALTAVADGHSMFGSGAQQAQIMTVIEPTGPTDRQYAEPHLAVHPRNPDQIVVGTIAVSSGMSWTVLAFQSRDGGRSWHQRDLPPLGRLVCFGDPWVVWGEREAVYLVCITQRPVPGRDDWDAALLFYRSDDGGVHWRAPLLIPDDEVRGSWDHPVARLAPNGDIVVAGTRSRVGPDGFAIARYQPDRHRFLPLQSYLPPEQVNNNFGSIVALPDERVVFTYFTMRNPPRPMYAVRVTPNGNERTLLREHITPWGFPMLASGTPTPSGPPPLYATWLEEDTAGGLNVFLMQSYDEGRHWSPPLRVNSDSVPAFRAIPQVAVSASGTVAVAWYDARHATQPRNVQPCGDMYLRRFDRDLAPVGGEVRTTASGRCPNNNDPAGARQRWRAGGDYLGLVFSGDGVANLVWAEPGPSGNRVRFARLLPVPKH